MLAASAAAQPVGEFSDLTVTDDLDVGDRLTVTGRITQPAPGPLVNHFRGNRNFFEGSACIGFGCDAAALAASTTSLLQIRGSEPRLIFEDTSETEPNRAWQIRANDTAAARGVFRIMDRAAVTTPFSIEGDAPTNALWIGTNGVGLGTSIPQADLHVVSNLTEKLRLQDAGSGADWSLIVATNGMGWFDRDGSGGGTFPFAILEGAPDDAWVLTGAGDVGMGTAAPDASLHISRDDGTAAVRVENARSSPPAAREMFAMVNNAGSYFTLENTRAETSWFFVHEDAAPNRFIITDAVPDGPEMTLTAEGDLTIPGQLFTAGSCAAGCDRVFDEDYPLPTIAEQAAMMRDLKHLPAVGPTPEDGPFNITAMTGGMLNELEKAHLYIAQLHAQNARQEARIARLEAALESR
ncbi:hypothetical protein [Thalassococcus sp. BH17M4-6]|uniref:hypothetical protein n=1 Tax=Thalassococcus sp. BH17M4-6 TaxID=3413148 RepID=UPI003BF48D92